MIEGLGDGALPTRSSDPRAACLASLAELDLPAAGQAVDTFLRDRAISPNGALGSPEFAFRVDRILPIAARRSERLRTRAASVWVGAWNARAEGFDQLRDIVCRPPVPTVSAKICERSLPDQEQSWANAARRDHFWRLTAMWAALSGALAVGGTVTRNEEAGRWFALTATTIAGGALLDLPLSLQDDAGDQGPLNGLGDAAEAAALLLGGAAGFGVGYLTTRSSGTSRAVTAIAGASVFGATMIVKSWRLASW
jgi:hypothetical protein